MLIYRKNIINIIRTSYLYSKITLPLEKAANQILLGIFWCSIGGFGAEVTSKKIAFKESDNPLFILALKLTIFFKPKIERWLLLIKIDQIDLKN